MTFRPWPWPSFTLQEIKEDELHYFLGLIKTTQGTNLYKNIERLKAELKLYDCNIKNYNSFGCDGGPWESNNSISECQSPRFGTDTPTSATITNNASNHVFDSSTPPIRQHDHIIDNYNTTNDTSYNDSIIRHTRINAHGRSSSMPIHSSNFANLVYAANDFDRTNKALADDDSMGNEWNSRYFNGNQKLFKLHQMEHLRAKNICYPAFLELKVFLDPYQTGYMELNDEFINEGSVTINNYQFESLIGRATHSLTFSAKHTISNKNVCIKMSLSHRDSIALSIAEINSITIIRNNNSLNHSIMDEYRENCKLNSADFNIVNMIDSFFYRGRVFTVTELLGPNLYELYSKPNVLNHTCKLISKNFQELQNKQGSVFSVKGIATIAKSLLISLIRLQELSLFHGDIKPENVLISCVNGECGVKLIDFGSSHFACEDINNYQQSRPYRAPEVVLGLPYDTKADLWSLGAMLAELWIGKLLFPSFNNPTLVSSIISLLGDIPAYMINVSNTFTNDSPFFISGKYVIHLDNSFTFKLITPKKSCLKTLLQITKPRDCDDDLLDKFYCFLTKLVTIDPAKRPDPREMINDPFIKIIN